MDGGDDVASIEVCQMVDPGTGGARGRLKSPIAIALIVAIALGASALAAWTVIGRINYGSCTTASWQSAVATETAALVPAGTRDPYTTKHDCDDRGYVSVEFQVVDTTAALNAVHQSASTRGWAVPVGQSTGGAPCFEKTVDGTPSVLVVGAMAPSSAWVEVQQGTCNQIDG
jgi:hypothetical protein